MFKHIAWLFKYWFTLFIRIKV